VSPRRDAPCRLCTFTNCNRPRIKVIPDVITSSQTAAHVGGRKNSRGNWRRVSGSAAGIRGEKRGQISGKGRSRGAAFQAKQLPAVYLLTCWPRDVLLLHLHHVCNKHDQESIEMGLFQHCSTLERTSCFHGLRLLSNIWLKLSGCGTGKDITKVPYMWRITELPLIPHSTVAQGNVILNSIITYLLTYLDHNSDLLCPLLR